MDMDEDAAPGEVKRLRRGVMVRSAAELLVIVVGVVIGLTVDRWMAGIDDEVQAERLTERLLTDIRGDSVDLQLRLAMYRTSGEELASVLEMIADPGSTVLDPTEFIQEIELRSWWVPFNPSRHTWDEVNSTGQLGLLDPQLRSALARYYQSLAFFTEVEARWAPSFQEYWSLQQSVLPPLLRMAAVEQRGGGPRGRELTYDEVAPVLTAFRENPALHGALGRLTGIYLYGAPAIEGTQKEANAAIAALVNMY
jgi:hypothetical protein